MTYTVGSLFSGIGGIDLAAQWAGFETAWFVEKEPYCQKVLSRHWPNTPIHSDVFECHDLPQVDVIVGGFPCQPFSVAGKRQGANDERFLLPEMLRIVQEVNPHVVLFENVPGFPSLNDGAEFKLLLWALAGMGFNAEWGHLRASDIGAPHRRERWFCVAYAKHFRGDGRRKCKDGCSISDKSETPIRGKYPIEIEGCGLNRTSAAVVDNTSGAGLEGCQEAGNAESGRTHRNELVTGYGAGESGGASQSRLGRTVDGVSCGLDTARWPARPNEPQHDYEPPRITSVTKNRAARLKALGNAVVPQVVYPLLVAIREWLDISG